MPRPLDAIREPMRNLAPDELAVQPVTALMGVSDRAAALLRTLGIRTVFDLGVSQLFHTARLLCDLASGGAGAMARFQQVPRELLDPGADAVSLADLARVPLSGLRSLDTAAAQRLEEVLGVTTLDELGRWAPYRAARELIEGTLADDLPTADPEIPDELVPRFNEYPTEKFFYSVYTLDAARPTSGFRPLEGALDLAELEKKDQHLQVRTGAIVRYEQAWMPVGLALGNLLHSLALAPGESTRIAMIDWSRRQGVRTSEDISQTESLASSLMHTRSINEVTQAVAREAQSGFSQMNANSTVSNTAYSGYGVQNAGEAMGGALAGAGAGLVAGAGAGAVGGAGVGAIAGLAGAGFGAIPGAIAGGLIGGGAGGLIGMAGGGVAGFLGTAEFGGTSTSGAETATEVVATTSSSGERELAASMAQNIADRTQQHSSSARNRRATIVQEVWQSESEEITTRAVTNYNHMHALTVQYFEVVQMYRLRTSVDHVQRALYIPMRTIKWSRDSIERYRAILVRHALDLRVLTALALPAASAAFTFPLLNRIDEATARGFLGQNEPRWGLEFAKKAVDGPVASTPLEPWVLPRDVVLEDFQVGRYMRTNSQASLFHEFEPFGQAADRGAVGLPLGSVHGLHWRLPARDEPDAKPMIMDVVVRFRYRDSQFFAVYPLVLDLEIYPATTGVVTIPIGVLDHAPEESWLVDHLTMFTKHYSRAVWRSVDESDITTLLSDYTFEGRPVVDHIDRKPVAISGQYLVFAYHHRPEPAWTEWLKAHGFLADRTASVELLPMPTGGVFAEAVQGRANAAERLDLTRFWNWQDSPIPLTAPEIAAVQAGSRATDANLVPGQLQAPIVNNLSVPGVPDPQGLGSVLGAIGNGNMFRDMSGLAEARQLAGQALQQAQAGATAAGEQAAANLAQGMAMHSQAIDKILSMFQDLSNQIAGAGFGAMTANLQNVGSKSISSAGAVVNKAAARDAARGVGKAAAAASGAAAGPSGSTAGPGGTAAPTAGGDAAAAAPESLEDDAIRTLIAGTSPSLGGTGGGVPGGGVPGGGVPGGGVQTAGFGNIGRAAILLETPPRSLVRLPELLAQAEPGQWFQDGQLQRDVTPGEVYGNLMVVFPLSGQLAYFDEADRSLYRTDYNTFFRSLVPLEALAAGGARAAWLDHVARVEFELMIGAIFGIPEIIAIRALGLVQALNTNRDEAAVLMEHFPALLRELKWFHDNFPASARCLVVEAVLEVFANVPASLLTLSAEKWAYLLGRFLKGGIASEAAKNLVLHLFITFGLTLAAFTALSVVPHAGIDVIEQQVTSLKNGLDGEGVDIDEQCLRTALTELLNHPNPDELKQKLQQIATSAEQLLPAVRKLFLESGSTLI
ncbi:MAG: hypothetical protein R3D98_15365 [Candidatus Krumholzibacteriia bacterium]